jgi:hypothetical protein
MLETVCKEIIAKNTFMIHFIDKNSDGINSDISNEITGYETNDDGVIKMGLRVNAIPPSISIDVKIQYPSNFYNPNYYELLDANEKQFKDFYNEIMNYNLMEYEIMDPEESYSKKFLVK